MSKDYKVSKPMKPSLSKLKNTQLKKKINKNRQTCPKCGKEFFSLGFQGHLNAHGRKETEMERHKYSENELQTAVEEAYKKGRDSVTLKELTIKEMLKTSTINGEPIRSRRGEEV